MADLLVKRDDLRECRVEESDAPEVAEGQALLRIDTFGMTANNVTYAVLGEQMSYWDFFPAPDGWGRLPTWGFAEVAESTVDGVTVGTRLYGYFPASSHLVVTPKPVGTGFLDGTPHRRQLPLVYNHYLATATDPFYTRDSEAIQMLLRPLFMTSLLIDDWLAEEGLTERGPIAMASASSKTAIAAAFLLSRREGVRLIGLTSARNVAFVEGLGIYDQTVAYDDIGTLDREAATFVDFAGSDSLRRAVHSHYGDLLAHSMHVGMTHWQDLQPTATDLPGPAPVFFFAPEWGAKRAKEWGPAELERRGVEAWRPFCEWIAGRVDPIRGEGFDAVRSAYLDVLEGRVEPARPHVLTV